MGEAGYLLYVTWPYTLKSSGAQLCDGKGILALYKSLREELDVFLENQAPSV